MFEKVWEALKLSFPAKRVYFIYTHRNGADRFQNGLKANTEISYWCYKALERRFPHVVFLRLQGEKPYRIRSIRSTDVVIGHVGETFLKASERTKRLIAFYPWSGHDDRSTNTLFNCMPKAEEMLYLEKAASTIFLTSEFNKREYVEKPRNFWHSFLKDKRLHLVHQPLDFALFKRIKFTYHTSDFLYIGNDAHMKCVPDSKALVNAVGRTLHLYGVEGRKLNHLDEKEVNVLPHLADFFIQPGMWEAQNVSILEAAARGFIPLVSPDTGYPYSHPFLLRYGDFAYNLKVLKEALSTTAEERKMLADALHEKLVNDPLHNNWDHLTDVLVEEVRQLQ